MQNAINMPTPPTNALLDYRIERWMDCRPDAPYLLLDYPLLGSRWRVTWWLGLN